MATEITKPILPWAACWPSGRLTILAARRDDRDAYASRRVGDTDDGWPRRSDARVPNLVPVERFELRIGSREIKNIPKLVFLRFDDRLVAWTYERPYGLSSSVLENDLDGPVAGDTSIWGYVWNDEEAVVFSAPDPEIASRWVMASASRWRIPISPLMHEVQRMIEPIDRIEVHLRPREDGLEPYCYRLWIENIKVGWPRPPGNPIGPIIPPDDDGDDHEAAELRLPIPRYDRVRAFPPGRKLARLIRAIHDDPA